MSLRKQCQCKEQTEMGVYAGRNLTVERTVERAGVKSLPFAWEGHEVGKEEELEPMEWGKSVVDVLRILLEPPSRYAELATNCSSFGVRQHRDAIRQ